MLAFKISEGNDARNNNDMRQTTSRQGATYLERKRMLIAFKTLKDRENSFLCGFNFWQQKSRTLELPRNLLGGRTLLVRFV